MSRQSKAHSLLETIVNVAIGYGVALASQLLIYPRYGIHISVGANVEIGMWFTIISIIRSYAVRRFFTCRTGG